MENMVGNNLLNTYSGKRVFITGHTGFKGSWLLMLLHHLGAITKGYALPPEYNHQLYKNVTEYGESILDDIRDKKRLRLEILSFQPDYIFHLAAQPLVRKSYAIPAETFETNVIGTANLLESITVLEKPCTVVVVTTDKVYRNVEKNILYKETDILGGYDPYSASKACTELVVDSFRNSFFSPDKFDTHQKGIASARAGNVIGGGDWSTDRIVPDIIRSLIRHHPVEVRNPLAVRPWQHVLEPLTGYLVLAAALVSNNSSKFSKAYNFGPNPADHLTVQSLVEKSIQYWGNGNWIDTADKSNPHEAGLLQLDIGLAKEDLKWEPKLTANDAIGWTINWYRQPDDKKEAFTLQQIETYLSL